MPRQTHYRPYAAISSERERLQRLRSFFEWLYKVYSSKEQFFSDFNRIQEDLGMGAGSGWGTVTLLAYMEEKNLKWYQDLHRQIRDDVEKHLAEWKENRQFLLPSYPRAMLLQGRSVGGVFMGFSHNASGEPDLLKIKNLIILRLADELLYGLNAEAIQQCQVCNHYMVKAHPRGKLFCSANCRVKAAMQKKKKSVRKTATAKG